MPTRCFDAASRGEKILFLEPSCLSAVAEDAPALLARRGAAPSAGRRRCMHPLRGYLERELAAGRLSLRSRPVRQPWCCTVMPARRRWGWWRLQARCPASRRARWWTSTRGAAAWPDSFGYSTDHYDVSKQIGERRLAARRRALKRGELLAAAGNVLRHQVAHFAGAEAQHPPSILHSLIE